MAQHHSPAIDYPVRLPLWWCWLWWGWMVLTALWLLLWWWQGAGRGMYWLCSVLGSMLLWGCCAVWSRQAMNHLHQGVLRWNPPHWEWCSARGVQVLRGKPRVLWDGGTQLWLGFAEGPWRQRRFWLQKNWEPSRWGGLRRAVYSRANPTPDAAVEVRAP